jgi:hypothetical protein
MPKKKTKKTTKAAAIVLDVEAARSSGEDEVGPATQALTVAERAIITSPVEMRVAVSWAAEIKERAAAVDAKRLGFVDPAQQIIDNANAFFKPAIAALNKAEKTVKGKISGYSNSLLEERDRVLAQVEDADEGRRAELLEQADALLPPKVPGCGMAHSWKGAVTDADRLIAWAVEHRRLDLLAPNEKTLKALTKAKGGDPQIPGWGARPDTVVSITVSKVERVG